MLIQQLAFPWSDTDTLERERQSHEEEANWAEELVQHGLLGLLMTTSSVIGEVRTYLLALAAHTCVLRSQREDVDDPGKNIQKYYACRDFSLARWRWCWLSLLHTKAERAEGNEAWSDARASNRENPFLPHGGGAGQEMVRKRRTW